MSIFDKRIPYKPFEYPEILTFTEAIQKAYWVHGEVDFTADIQDYHSSLDKVKREIHKRSILSIAQIEVCVKSFWGDLYRYFPKPEMNLLGSNFAECEGRHSEAYSRILEVNGYLDEFEKALQNPVFKKYNDFVSEIMKDTSKSIVEKLLFFALVIEDSSLFSKFANILSFTHFDGLMKNTSNIIAWTSTDEQCFPLDTTVLTPSGWKLISEMKIGDSIYGFNKGLLKEEKVINTIRKGFKGRLITTGNNRHSISTTPTHDMIYIKNGEWKKGKANDIKYNNHISVPVTSEFIGDSEYNLTPLDRLKIAIQADGTKLYWINENGEKLERGKDGGENYSISVYKKRKINRLKEILDKSGLFYTESDIKTNTTPGKQFKFHLDYLSDYKNLDWVYETNILKSKKSAEEFIGEVLAWDGYIGRNEISYTSTNKNCVSIVEHIAILAGYRTSVYENNDSLRSENFNNSYKITLSNKDSVSVLGNSYNTDDTYEYEQDVVCVTVPSGGIIVKQGDKSPFIAGNCHANAGIYLINKIREEGLMPEGLDQEWVEKTVRGYIEQESEMLDWIFELGELPYYTKNDLLNYMKYRLDDSIKKVGFQKVFKISKEDYKPMAWFEEEVFSGSYDDFFAKRPVDYTKHDKSISADDLF